MQQLSSAEYNQSVNLIKKTIVFSITLSIIYACTGCNNNSDTNIPPSGNDSVAIKKKAVLDDQANASIYKKKIYLTFDDGPNKGTRNVHQVIYEEKVAASFFIVGLHTADTRQQRETFDILKNDSTVELCNHSYTHAHNRYTSFYQHPDQVIADFQQAQAALGFKNNIARMPGRNAWRIDSVNHTDIYESKEAIDSLYAAGFSILGWDIEWMFDHKTLAPDADTDLLLRRIANMLDAASTKTKGHLVLLAHDQAFQKEEYMQQLHYVIQQLKNNPEYELVFASKYPGIKKILLQ